MSIPDDVRAQLIRLAGSRKTREAEFSRARPCHWSPRQVRCPSTKQPFTDDGAWEFVRLALEDGADVEQIALEIPKGKSGYVMLLAGTGAEMIYVKLQLGGGIVIGRSFHISTKS